MIKQLFLATTNANKLEEFQNILGQKYDLKTLLDIKQFLGTEIEDIEETGATFIENALIKARTLSKLLQKPVLGDDSGLEILALDNFPGIYSARWMDTTDGFMQASNVILEKMMNIKFRDCRYVCALAFVDVTKNIEKVFVGSLNGLIHSERQGNYNFGYDAIFYLPEYKKTLGEITAQEKNQISHRAIAIQKMVNWINKEDNNEY
ncbi:RdgB/HAM1 family non-canonical purine NTP pyrophosphatase [Spiroplasma endosymbiont of Tipula paludosa]|uniref:RdgB/HAM1 family non-canonical purine NTP pyrophosphatase n=1 Tax=Spiroplasma endosymbiont of Tipula paludosa TaxID=3066295 RepID=UPI0035C8C1D9